MRMNVGHCWMAAMLKPVLLPPLSLWERPLGQVVITGLCLPWLVEPVLRLMGLLRSCKSMIVVVDDLMW